MLDFLGYFNIISNIQTYTGIIVECSLVGFLQIWTKMLHKIYAKD